VPSKLTTWNESLVASGGHGIIIGAGGLHVAFFGQLTGSCA
jgi:hypothetical protein